MASKSYALAEKMLSKDSGVSYQDVKAAAEKKGLSLPPIVYGRAKRALGLTAAKAPAAKAPVTRKAAARGRPRKVGRKATRRASSAASQSALGELQEVLQSVQQLEADRTRMRAALEELRGVLERALN